MCDRLMHRGPDDVGIYQGDRIVLGHTRLSIIDVDGGHQPLSNEDDTVWTVLNGEIYNYKELRAELIAGGHLFATNSDTEVIVHLYESEGVRLMEKLNGMFAFALWDSKNRKLLLVRDRLGIKPLYYSFGKDGLIFASEMKAILAVPSVSRDIDNEAIAEYLTLGYIPEPKTPFQQIRKLRRGCYLEYSHSGIAERHYWQMPVPGSDCGRSVPDLCDEIRFLIQDSTRLQLRADVPVGLFASGGIDSTAIMWAAARQNTSLEAFLVEFDHLAEDTPYARIAASSSGMKLHEEHLSSAGACLLLPKLLWYLDEPLADTAIVPCYLIARSASRRVKVILNGTGGDELFGGYPRYLLRSLLPNGWYSVANALSGACCSHPALARVGAVLDVRQRFLHHLYLFNETEARAGMDLKGEGRISRLVRGLFAAGRAGDAQAAMMFVDLNLYLPDDLFLLLDRMTMAASLEARVPLLDHRLVELAAVLPGRLKMRGGELKLLMRRALRGCVPDQILDRPKQGFGPPVQAWMNGTLGAASLTLLSSKRAGISNLLSKKQIASWLSPQKQAGTRGAMRTWALLILELWWQTFVENRNLSEVGMEQLATAGAGR
jgi:asparagine synthase (glutamine-hydrolysing)